MFSVAEGMEVNVVAEEEQCNVRNLSCVAFPTVKQCTGISVGGCMCKLFQLSKVELVLRLWCQLIMPSIPHT